MDELLTFPEECVNYNSKRKSCNALVVKHCTPERCSFFITCKHANDTLTYAYERLAKLPKEQQERIARNYFNNKMPWKQVQTPCE